MLVLGPGEPRRDGDGDGAGGEDHEWKVTAELLLAWVLLSRLYLVLSGELAGQWSRMFLHAAVRDAQAKHCFTSWGVRASLLLLQLLEMLFLFLTQPGPPEHPTCACVPPR